MSERIAAPKLLDGPEVAAVGTKLLDRYVLPKVAMVLILISAAGGAWVALRDEGSPPGLVLARWIYVIMLAIIAGGSVWGAYYTRDQYDQDDVEAPSRFLQLEFARYLRIQKAALAVLVLAGLYGMAVAASNNGQYAAAKIWLQALQLLSWLAMATIIAFPRGKPQESSGAWLQVQQSRLKVIVLLSLIGLGSAAALDVVSDYGLDIPSIVARWFHLAAVGIWFGGAVWNVFVAVPAARRSLGFETVFAAASQLDAFRRVVRFALPLVVVTGLYQAYRLFGLDLSALLQPPIGLLVLLKLALIVALFGIFLACPMWKACSPIAGVCDITDLDPALRAKSGWDQEADDVA